MKSPHKLWHGLSSCKLIGSYHFAKPNVAATLHFSCQDPSKLVMNMAVMCPQSKVYLRGFRLNHFVLRFSCRLFTEQHLFPTSLLANAWFCILFICFCIVLKMLHTWILLCGAGIIIFREWNLNKNESQTSSEKNIILHLQMIAFSLMSWGCIMKLCEKNCTKNVHLSTTVNMLHMLRI